jgi:hypothetical protein
MIKKLTKVWKTFETGDFSIVFEGYMESLGVKKHDSRRKDNRNTYMIDGKSTNWNRVQCYYHKDSEKYCEENLLLVLRKEAGDYFIVQRRDKRAFEVDYSGIRHYDENLMNEIYAEHQPLFDKLFEIAEQRSEGK